jgi:hypothetical protein
MGFETFTAVKAMFSSVTPCDHVDNFLLDYTVPQSMDNYGPIIERQFFYTLAATTLE